jgi:TatD DNase family protein
MWIDIHRHSNDSGTANITVRNLFHTQNLEIEKGRLYTIGLHPWHVKESSVSSDIGKVEEIADHPQIIAIGEAGLDKSIKVPFDIQLRVFEAQMEIAQKVNKPMIIHCVKAYNEIVSLKSKSGQQKPWIIHWFNATREMGEQLISKDFYLSFGHMLFNTNSKAYKSFPHLPLNRIFFETDDAGYRIDEVYSHAARLRNIDENDLQELVRQNFIQCFGVRL